MNNAPSVSESAGFLTEFRAALQDFAAREEALENDFRTRLKAAEKRLADQRQSTAGEISRQVAEEQARFASLKQRLEERMEQRNNRITRLHASAKSKAADQVESDEGRRKYALQKSMLDAQRAFEEENRQLDAALSDFESRAAAEETALHDLGRAAAQAFRGFGSLRHLLAQEYAATETAGDESTLLGQVHQNRTATADKLARFESLWLPAFFRRIRLGLILLLVVGCAVALPFALRSLGQNGITLQQSLLGGGVALVLLIAAWLIGRWQATPPAREIARSLGASHSLLAVARERARTRHTAEKQRLQSGHDRQGEQLEKEWNTTIHEAAEARELIPKTLEVKRRRAVATNQRLHLARIERLSREHHAFMARWEGTTAERARELADAAEDEIARLKAAHEENRRRFESERATALDRFSRELQQAQARTAQDFPDWTSPDFRNWTPPDSFLNRARFAELQAELQPAPAESAPAPGLPAAATLPLQLRFPDQGSLLFETSESAAQGPAAALNNIILRLLTTSPAGKLNFTLIDPVNLGQNFAAILHLADYEDNVINGRIWTQPGQIEEQLAELNEHIEKVIQMYLRNEYATIAEYNAEAGNIAEKYHFLVIADFPHNFSEAATRSLLRIASSGPRCGVFTLIHWDQRHPAPQAFLPEELRQNSICLTRAGDRFVLAQPPVNHATVRLDAPPEPTATTELLHRIGQANVGASRVTVPFTQITPPEGRLWSLDTGEELRVPIGRTGATKLQYLALGKGTRQHALIAGKTGSGKSTLLHVIITNLALWCSPEEVEFYLVDFKRGVEFKDYATKQLPHARVVAIESDREFGLSVLQRVDEELKRRGELFREAGVQDIASYRKAPGAQPMPRSLLIIDEFQEYFVEDDRISQAAAVLLDRIVRQGRAFGIHVILGSHTLGGAYTIARSTMGQMVVRIALQCNEADSYLIMDESNPAPRLLSRPGEGIYNDMAGNIEGNSPFQTVWLSPEEREQALDQVHDRAETAAPAFPLPVVFEGNTPADVRDNRLLRDLLARQTPAPEIPRVWLGAPNSIKGPTEAPFHRRSGSNLLVVGQREEAALALTAISIVTLAAQLPDGARLILLESSAPGSPAHNLLSGLATRLPSLTLAAPGDVDPILADLSAELQRRLDQPSAPAAPIFILIHGLQHFRKLRPEDEFAFSLDEGGAPANPAAQLQKILTEGPALGIHTIATIDTASNVTRFLGRKSLAEFYLRVLFQMSAHDSAALCDDPKASTLGLHRALLYNEQQGSLETFRPYALPPAEWLT